MRGIIRPRGKCSRCDRQYREVKSAGFVCPACGSAPERYFIDLAYKGERYRIYSDRRGDSLTKFRDARSMQESITHDLMAGTFDIRDYQQAEVKKFLFSNALTEWLDQKGREVNKSSRAPSTLKTYRVYADRYFKPHFRDEDIREIRTYHIQEFYNTLSDRLTPKYQKCILKALENFFNTMLRLERIKRKPVFPVISVQEPVAQWATREVQDRILSRIRKEDRPIFTLLMRQGLRPAEGRALKVKDLDLAHGVLTVARGYSENTLIERTKSRKTTARLINPELLPMLRDLCSEKLPEAFLFTNPRTGKPYYDKTLNMIWNRACKAAGVKISLYNGTRHSLASQAATAGAPVQAIQGVLGHTDLRTTMKYAKTDLLNQSKVFESASLATVSRLSLEKKRARKKV